MQLIQTIAMGLTLTAAIAASAPPTIKLDLLPLHGSRERGTATLTPRGTGLIISIEVVGAGSGATQFAHFHRGTCEHIESPAVYELQPVRNGRSTTTLETVSLDSLIHGTYSILIHKTLSHTSPHVACGTVAGA